MRNPNDSNGPDHTYQLVVLGTSRVLKTVKLDAVTVAQLNFAYGVNRSGKRYVRVD